MVHLVNEHAAMQLADVQQPGACGAGRRALQQALAHAAHRLLVAPAGASRTFTYRCYAQAHNSTLCGYIKAKSYDLQSRF